MTNEVTKRKIDMDDVTPGLMGITPRQEHAVVALLSEPTMASAAKAVGVSERTIHRWLCDPHFLAAYAKARRKVNSHAIGLAQRHASRAVTVLLEAMDDKKAPWASRILAATSILKVGRLSDFDELDDDMRAPKKVNGRVLAQPTKDDVVSAAIAYAIDSMEGEFLTADVLDVVKKQGYETTTESVSREIAKHEKDGTIRRISTTAAIGGNTWVKSGTGIIGIIEKESTNEFE